MDIVLFEIVINIFYRRHPKMREVIITTTSGTMQKYNESGRIGCFGTNKGFSILNNLIANGVSFGSEGFFDFLWNGVITLREAEIKWKIEKYIIFS